CIFTIVVPDMKKPLLDVIFASEKRKNILLLLQDGPKQMEFLLRSLDTTRQALLPQLKTLEEHYLVDHYDDTYELTTIGKLTAKEMNPLLESLEIFDNDIDYWGTRKLDFVPPYLLKRINELGKCSIINPPLTDIHAIRAKFLKDNKRSDSIFVITTFFFANYITLFSELIESNVDIYFIIDPGLYEKLQIENDTVLREFVKNKRVQLFVYNKKMEFISFAFNDYCILLRILESRGANDHKMLVCSGQSALAWGKELFEYYLKDSKPITEL
ncbi:helix-turn-helix transcriptional regulator, partial [Methanomethylovorans sp.]|uniref:helix-turn-helix transcriptional regulator n=1 Tax=Methanomethylovorans sp. TaxID=2758717 RepID=UPI00351C20F9